MGDVMEADSQDLGNVVAEDVGHQHVCILALAQVHGVRDVPDDVKVGIEQLHPCMEKVHLELFPLLSIGLTGQDLVDELKVRALHDIDYPTKIELYPVLCDIVLCLCAFFVVLGFDHLQRPTAKQKVLDHIVIRNLGSFFEDAIEN